MDIEGCHWLGGYKITGKTNYVTETCHRMDVLFGGGLTPDELEWRRLNQVFVMTHGGHTMTLDELNELLNWWNKGIVTSPDFETVCNQTRFVSITRGCMHDTFGPGNRKSKKPSVEKDIECLMDLLRNANLWSPNRTEKRELYGDFYWDLYRPRENVGSEKSKKKESVCESTQVQRLFDILCSTDEQRDFDEFEVNEEGDDDANISVVSSTMSSYHGVNPSPLNEEEHEDDDEQPWEQLNEVGRQGNIDRACKKNSNMKKGE